MNEHVVMTLLGIGSVATAISGFSGVVAVFGGRAEGKWAPEERFRTMNMLILSLGACLLSFVPLIEEMFQVPEAALWVSASLLLGIFGVFYFAYTVMMMLRLHLLRPGVLVKWVGVIYFICLTVSIILQTLNISGWINRGPGPFVGGLIFMLVPAGLQFAFLVLTPLTNEDFTPYP